MSDRTETMNLKLNNEIKGSVTTEKSSDSLVKDEQEAKRSQREEERRRTGRYMAILVGISLFILALYHAWVRRIPIVASLVVPALIMFVYVAWILYTASREKHRDNESIFNSDYQTQLNTSTNNMFRLFDVEVGQTAPEEGDGDIAITELTQNNADTSVASNKENDTNCTEDITNWTNISTALMKGDKNIHADIEHNRLPIILVNDKPPEDLDQKWLNIVELTNNDKLRVFHTRRKYKRRFCRSRRHAAFKRSYSIG